MQNSYEFIFLAEREERPVNGMPSMRKSEASLATHEDTQIGDHII